MNSAEYTIIQQDLSNPLQAVKMGTINKAGSFYFDNGIGSFDIEIDDFKTEDVFNITESSSGISLSGIIQNVESTTLSQYVIAFSGDKISDTSMTLSGSITNQSLSGQFVLSGTFILEKQ